MEILNRFERELTRMDASEKTIKSYRGDLIKFYEYIKERLNDNSVGFEEGLIIVDYKFLEEFRESLEDQNYSRATINRIIISLKSFFKYYSRFTKTNPCEELRGYKKTNSKEKKSLSKDEVIRLLNQTQTKRYGERFTDFLSARDIFLISLLSTTGLRIEEALTLTFGDIEKFDDYIIANITIHEGTTKLNKRIPISGKVLNYYNNYMVEYEKKYDMLPDSYIIVSPRSGKKIATTDSNHMIKKYCKEIGLEGISNHCFRKFANNALLVTGANTTIINSILGWSDKSMSGSVYLDDKQLDGIKAEYCRKILE